MATLQRTVFDTTQYVRISVGTNANRPGSPSAGQMRFNTDTGLVETWNGSAWVNMIEQVLPEMNIVEFMLSPKGMFYKGRLVWAGDNAEKEPECSENLYEMAQNKNDFRMSTIPSLPYRYIVNHTKQQYVDKNKVKEIHPLALLVSEGGAGGGGDYYGKNDHLCGTWSRDVISMENEIPNTFVELECEFE